MKNFSYLILFVVFFLSTSCLRSPPPPPLQIPNVIPGVDRTDVLIYNGKGSWPAEVASLKETLFRNGATYEDTDSTALNKLSAEDIRHYRLIIFPGGDAITVTNNLTIETHERLRKAVQELGLNYLGFCAGAWMAVAPAPVGTNDVGYGIGVVDGPILQPNYLAKEGLHYAITKAHFPDGSTRDQLWYGGPITPDIPGGVIAKYPNNTPAISQIRSGKGLVILSGLHPTATKEVLNNLGLYNKAAIAPDLAWKILNAGIQGVPLPSF